VKIADRARRAVLVAGIFLGALGALGAAAAAATPKRTPALDAMMARVHCGFGDEGGDADVSCQDDGGMFLCETLRAQNKVSGCSIDPARSRVPDLDNIKDADFVKDGKMDKVASRQPCIVWAYNEGYVAPSRSRWQHACAVQLLDSLSCSTATGDAAPFTCPAASKPVCAVLQQAHHVAACK
jgi:hypothetical protein